MMHYATPGGSSHAANVPQPVTSKKRHRNLPPDPAAWSQRQDSAWASAYAPSSDEEEGSTAGAPPPSPPANYQYGIGAPPTSPLSDPHPSSSSSTFGIWPQDSGFAPPRKRVHLDDEQMGKLASLSLHSSHRRNSHGRSTRVRKMVPGPPEPPTPLLDLHPPAVPPSSPSHRPSGLLGSVPLPAILHPDLVLEPSAARSTSPALAEVDMQSVKDGPKSWEYEKDRIWIESLDDSDESNASSRGDAPLCTNAASELVLNPELISKLEEEATRRVLAASSGVPEVDYDRPRMLRSLPRRMPGASSAASSEGTTPSTTRGSTPAPTANRDAALVLWRSPESVVSPPTFTMQPQTAPFSFDSTKFKSGPGAAGHVHASTDDCEPPQAASIEID